MIDQDDPPPGTAILPIFAYSVGYQCGLAWVDGQWLEPLQLLNLDYWYIGDRRDAGKLRRVFPGRRPDGGRTSKFVHLHRIIAVGITDGRLPQTIPELFDRLDALIPQIGFHDRSRVWDCRSTNLIIPSMTAYPRRGAMSRIVTSDQEEFKKTKQHMEQELLIIKEKRQAPGGRELPLPQETISQAETHEDRHIHDEQDGIDFTKQHDDAGAEYHAKVGKGYMDLLDYTMQDNPTERPESLELPEEPDQPPKSLPDQDPNGA